MPVRVRIEFGSVYRSRDLIGTAVPAQGQAPPLVGILVAIENSEEFWTGFRQATEGRLNFVTGNEGAWRIDLTGSNAASGAMSTCVRRMGRATLPFDQTPSRPFNSSPSVPFDSVPLPVFFDG